MRYDIAVPDLEAFIERYRKVHVPLWTDPSPVNKGRAVLVAREDFKRFMTFEGTVTHQAMRSEQVWP